MSSNSINFNINQINETENGTNYKVEVKVPMSLGWIDNMTIIVDKGNEQLPIKLNYKKLENGDVYFESDVFLETRAVYHYHFECLTNGEEMTFKDENNENWKISVNFKTSAWAKGGIMYHIFADRYNRGVEEKKSMPRRTVYKSFDDDMIIGPNEEGIWNADFYGGDLKGIEKELDYIKSLGTSIIYLSPIVYSQSNHRYDTSDYEMVDPYAGTNEDLKNLCQSVHQKGMHIILDAVFNHTGNDSKYFNEYNTFDVVGAYQSKDSKYAPFYRTINNDNHPQYDYWWGMKNLPVCDGHSKEWQEYIFGEKGIIDKWFALGIDGLRLDVADELTDEFIEGIRTACKRNKEDSFILGEVWKNPMRMNRGYLESGKGMDSVMNYHFADALIRYFKYADVDKLATIIKEIKRDYPDETINTLMNFTSTHDISRPINIFASNDFKQDGEWAWNLKTEDLGYCKNRILTKEEYEHGKELYESYVYTLAFMPGILSIFYGDEIGMQGLGNLANRKPFSRKNQDKELLDFFKYIGTIRNKETFLQEAKIEMLDINTNNFMFERIAKGQRALIAVNRTKDIHEIKIPEEYQQKKAKVYTLKKSTRNILNPYGGIAVVKNTF